MYVIVCNNVCVGICTRAPERVYLCVYNICACVYVVTAQTYFAPQTAVERPHRVSRYGHSGLELVIIDKT